MKRRLATLVVACSACLPACAHADYGTFYDVLAAGQGENVNALALTRYELTGQPPSTFVDQLPMYEGLVTAAPTLEPARLDRYFKDETNGAVSGPIVSTESPRPGLVIKRDQWNVPHIVGDTRAATYFGVGYAQAEDRLFFMDLLRHLARGRLAQWVGPGPDNSFLAMDADQLRLSDYTESELQRLIDSGVQAAGSDGPALLGDLESFTAGINAYIALTRRDPTKLPAEYLGVARLPQPWSNVDTAAVATLIAGLEGYGGGREVDDASVLQAASARFGPAAGRRVFEDFRERDDPTAPATTARRFPFDQPGPPSPKAVAIPDPGSVRPMGAVLTAAVGAHAGSRPSRTLVLSAPAEPPMHSSALMIDASRSKSGHPLALMGPQLGFFSPEALVEMDVHGPGINVSGVMLPGVFLVIMGRGPDFAWSATTATTDDTDEFVEKLCNADGSRATMSSDHYLYRGRCIPLVRREQVMTTPGPNGLSPTQLPETVTFELERSVHGPIQARATVHGQPVAIALARSSYFHDLDGAESFDLLSTGRVHDAAEFQRAMARVDLGFNWFYADDRSVSFVQSGWYPHRARGTDPSLPAWGTGRWDWRGFDPRTFTESHIGYRGLPKDTDPRSGYIINWNNDAARGWTAADNEWSYGPIFRSVMFEQGVRRALAHHRKLDLTGLVRVFEDVATADLRGRVLYPLLRRVISRHPPEAVAAALAALDAWVAHGSHRRDLNGDNIYEDSAGVALMDAWWPILMQRVFSPVLGSALMGRIQALVSFARVPALGASAFGGGWWNYLSRDLRSLVGERIRDPLSRRYCGATRAGGHGRRAVLIRCRAILTTSLEQAVAAVQAQQGSDMSGWKVRATCPATPTVPQGCDQIEFTTAGGVSTPPIPWQNRPTYQQAVEIFARRP
jgi:acyl-homoserine lactone acylase PvdQ